MIMWPALSPDSSDYIGSARCREVERRQDQEAVHQ